MDIASPDQTDRRMRVKSDLRDWWEGEPKDGFWFRCVNRFRMSLLKPSIPTITEDVQGRAKKASKRGGGSAISARAMQRGDRLVG